MTGQPTTSRPAGIEASDMLIDGDAEGVRLFLRNKRPVDRAPTGSLLLVHGATFPSVSLFDVDPESDGAGGSFLDALARAGIDAWALDVRGYGGSTRPGAMNEAPSGGMPLVRATEAAGDVARALAHVRSARPPAPLGLLGMSWGGSVAGVHAARDDGLDALVLVAPLWLSTRPLRFDAGGPLVTHREADVNAYRTAWLAAAPEGSRDELLPAGWFERWAEVTAATDAGARPGHVRAPGGAVADVREHWTAGRPLYDPAAITAPTLVIRGSWDVDVRREMALDLLDRLGTRSRVYHEIAGGTHMMLMEPARGSAFREIIGFVSEAFARVAGSTAE